MWFVNDDISNPYSALHIIYIYIIVIIILPLGLNINAQTQQRKTRETERETERFKIALWTQRTTEFGAERRIEHSGNGAACRSKQQYCSKQSEGVPCTLCGCCVVRCGNDNNNNNIVEPSRRRRQEQQWRPKASTYSGEQRQHSPARTQHNLRKTTPCILFLSPFPRFTFNAYLDCFPPFFIRGDRIKEARSPADKLASLWPVYFCMQSS